MQRTRDFYECRAELYDLAFSWDVGEEVDWLMGRLRPSRLLEPACGSGRMLVAFARRGVSVAGVDLSASMLAIARERLLACGVEQPSLLRADFEDFDLGARFDAAVCPVSSFGYLPDFDAAARHLACMARHLDRGARYLVQLELHRTDPYSPTSSSEHSAWEEETARGRLRTSWFGRGYDAARAIEVQVSRFEFTSGPDAGSLVEDEHEMRVWSFGEWSELVAGSDFTLTAAWDGTRPERPPLSLGPGLEDRPLTWLELVRDG